MCSRGLGGTSIVRVHIESMGLIGSRQAARAWKPYLPCHRSFGRKVSIWTEYLHGRVHIMPVCSRVGTELDRLTHGCLSILTSPTGATNISQGEEPRHGNSRLRKIATRAGNRTRPSMGAKRERSPSRQWTVRTKDGLLRATVQPPQASVLDLDKKKNCI